jgi:KDO2-lipid IV(A) lauroyltransferase
MPKDTPNQPLAAVQGKIALWLRLLAGLPWGVLYAITGALAWVMRYVLRYRLHVARDNLQRCFPDLPGAEIERLLTLHYRQLGQVMAEFIKLARLSAAELSARVAMVNLAGVQAETQAGRAVLLLGAHHCNWEWSLHGVALQVGVPMEAAYKPLHSAAADRQLRLLRERFGARLIAAKKMLREVARRRHEVRAVAMIADQVPASSDGRLWLHFLGRETAFYPGPAQLARSTGYAAFFAAMTRTGRGQYQIEFQPVCAAGERLEPEAFTARYAERLETLIRANPADWTWTHRRWKLRRPEEPTALVGETPARTAGATAPSAPPIS